MELLELHRHFQKYGLIEKGWSKTTVDGQRHAITCLINRTGISFLNEVTEELLRAWFYEGKEKYLWSSSHYKNYWTYLNQ